ncbi:MAG: GNAT family N-acetyltransferase [bacterium]
MLLCRDLGPTVRFLERSGPAAASLLCLATGRAGERARWVRADNPADPQVVLARHHWLYLYSSTRSKGTPALDWLPARWQRRFAATPGWVHRRLARLGRVGWQTRCEMYALTDPGRLPDRSAHRVGPLRAEDAPTIARHWPYGRRPDYIVGRISRGPGAAIRREGRLVAWALTHADGALGFLHVLDEFRGQGMARSIGIRLARCQLRLGIRPFVYIERTNRPSLSLTQSLGFEPFGEYVWFGP